MRDEFINHLDMFGRALGVLDLTAHRPLWENQPPLVFTAKVGEARIMDEALGDAQKRQEAGTGGSTDQKDREETELEDAVYILAQAGAMFFRDANPAPQESLAAEMDLTPSAWEDLRDQQLLAKSQLVVDRLLPLTTGAPTAVARAAAYGITPESVAALVKERKDFADIVNAPEVAVAIRVALTKGFRPAVRLTEGRFKELDKLILQFGKTAAGRGMIAAWQAARVLKGPGQGSGGNSGGSGPGPTPPTP